MITALDSDTVPFHDWMSIQAFLEACEDAAGSEGSHPRVDKLGQEYARLRHRGGENAQAWLEMEILQEAQECFYGDDEERNPVPQAYVDEYVDGLFELYEIH
jgi:hypothetical protein